MQGIQSFINRARTGGMNNISTSQSRTPLSAESWADTGLESIVTDDAVVHFVYDVKNPPPRPCLTTTTTTSSQVANESQGSEQAASWTRFVCISDTHCNTFEVPEGDVLLHAGDLTHTGRFKQMKPTVKWLKRLPHPHKIIIAGNHDLALDRDWYIGNGQRWHRMGIEDPDDVRDLMNPDKGDKTFHYLQYESCEIEQGGRKWKVYGSPGSPWFGGWAFNYKLGEEAEALTNAIPDDVDILLTHGPPHRILDNTSRNVNAGCEALKAKLGVNFRPVVHIFGHIHEARGAIVHEWPVEAGSDTGSQRRFTVFVNAAVQATPNHQNILLEGTDGPHYPPIIVDIKTPTA